MTTIKLDRYFFINVGLVLLLSFPCLIAAKDKQPPPLKRISPQEVVGTIFDGKEASEEVEQKLSGEQLFLDPDLGIVTISKIPGVRWQDCRLDPELCVAWPDPSAKIKRVPGEKILYVAHPHPGTGRVENVPYVKIEYEYQRVVKEKPNEPPRILTQKGSGWIDARLLRAEKQTPLYARKKAGADNKSSSTGTKESCNSPTQQKSFSVNQLRDLQKHLPSDAESRVQVSVDEVKKVIGQCPLNPPTQKKTNQWKGKNIYEHEMLPYWNRLAPPKGLAKEVRPGEFVPATKEDLINIDVLARTLYSEMNECFSVGLQFPMAVAKVAMNRTELAEQGRAPDHYVDNDSKLPRLSRILTAPSQFSVWNNVTNPRDKTLLMALCPTRNDSPRNWKGETPNPMDLYAWEKSVQIATEAVLFPARFRERTREVTQLYYTSKRSQFLKGYESPKPAPKIEGRPVHSYQCMFLWEKK